MGQYGTYDRYVVDGSNSDVGQGGAAAVNLSAVMGVLSLSVKTAKEPMTVDRLGFNPVTAFVSLTTNAQLGLYRYPLGLICVDLPSAIDMYNSLLVAMRAHAADATMHTAAPDTVNFPGTMAAVVQGDLAGLLVGVNLLQTAYAAHNTDANLGSAWVFHIAQVNHALANSTPSTTLAMAIAKLNDMLTKYNLHDLSAVCHTIGNLHPAYKVLLATITLTNGDAVGFEYVCDVDNKAQKAVAPYTGVKSRGVADLVPGDQVAIEVLVLAAGSVSGTYQPFFCWHNRAETENVMTHLVNRTPVKAAVNDSFA
jgi:hypothetical protein